MLIGVPKEIKNHEYRVGMVPGSVREVVGNGHEVIIQTGAGDRIGCSDTDYKAVGAKIIETAEEIFANADMIVKVKEPQPQECKMLREGQVLFTYLHLAPDPEQTKMLQESGCVAIAYETVTDQFGGLPLLTPMSQIAGCLSIQAGAHCLETAQGGSGVLLSGGSGVAPAKVLVIGGGIVGVHAIRMALGLEGRVTVLDKSLRKLQELDFLFNGKLNSIYSTEEVLEEYVTNADLVIGAVLVPGAAAKKLITRDMLKRMRKGSVIVDVAIDQGGCCETSRPTTHSDPTYIVDDIVHYCVANMPSAVARTSAFALNNCTLPNLMALANKGYKQALMDDRHLMNGLNVYRGFITHAEVAKSLGQEYRPAAEALV